MVNTENRRTARIIRSSKREFACLLEDTKKEVKAVCLREVLKDSHPVVGDLVILETQKNDDRFAITERLERKNEIFRRIVRSNKKKVIASNVDVILIVMSVSNPKYKPLLTDRYIARSCEWEIPMIVIFNKMDELPDDLDLELEKKKLELIGVNYFEISNVKSDPHYKIIKT